MSSRHSAALAGLFLVACTTRAVSGDGGHDSSGTAASGGEGSTVGSTSGSGRTTGSSSSSTGSSATGGASTSGSTTGFPRSPYADGGYVFCSGEIDGGPAHWTCAPGFYFCDEGGAGACDQCRGDSDCADQSLPTYDPRRPRCDLDSGIAGYQNTCVQCLGSSDCTGNSTGPDCDLDPNFPPNGLVPPIVTLGFETCTRLITDCRRLDGPDCRIFDQVCDAASGRCLDRAASCTTDQDCQGVFQVQPHPNGWWYNLQFLYYIGSPYLPQPYCVAGTCKWCPGGLCPNSNYCLADSDCGNPTSSPTGPSCDLEIEECVCTSSAQCSGFWPACVGLDGGRVNDAGQATGVCSCDDSSQCGDGGLICIPATEKAAPPWTIDPNPLVVPTIFGDQAGSAFCGVPCISPQFPSCSVMTGWSVCDLNDGLCKSCTNNVECESSYGSGGPFCDLSYREAVPGFCGCNTDADCPYAYSCISPEEADPLRVVGSCVATFSRCVPGDCGKYYCNWDSGSCNDIADNQTFPTCLSDYDCAPGNLCLSGTCVQCRDNADCAKLGRSTQTKCCQGTLACSSANVPFLNECAAICVSDEDCLGNSSGPHCWLGSKGYGRCGCGQNADCSGKTAGDHCVTDGDAGNVGSCVCLTAADCAAGNWCAPYGAGVDTCTSQCFDDTSCPAGYLCDSRNLCRPRCDDGRSCPVADPLCDLANRNGQNGLGLHGDAGDARWCYQCLDGRDCSGGLGCDFGKCDLCYYQSNSCASGKVCGLDGLCHASCSGSPCPAGQVCDALGLAGFGVDVCFECLSPQDCPNGEGCNSQTHSCGTCLGPTAAGAPNDCPPDAICSNYWHAATPGVCLQNCDRASCPASAPNCEVFAALTTDHSYCFGCIQDEDCPDGGWCDLSVNRTFSCQPAVGP